VHTNEEIEQFGDMYISCNVSLLPNPLPNAQQHQHMYVHVKRKIMLFVKFITHCLLCLKQKTHNLLKKMGIIHFENNIYIHKQKKKNQSLEKLFKNMYISFFQFSDSLNLNENTYKLSLKRKLLKSLFLIELL